MKRFLGRNALLFTILLTLGTVALAGCAGDQGARGNAGAAGAAGDQGAQGQVGPQGTQGATGPKGVTGDRGPVGPVVPASLSLSAWQVTAGPMDITVYGSGFPANASTTVEFRSSSDAEIATGSVVAGAGGAFSLQMEVANDVKTGLYSFRASIDNLGNVASAPLRVVSGGK